MRLHLDFKPQKAGFNVQHHQSIFMIGSCFTEHMGKKLSELKFDLCLNPHGVLFNPASICGAIHQLIAPKELSPDLFVELSGYWFSYWHHSKIKAIHAEALQEHIRTIDIQAQTRLKKAQYLFITLGSAYYYYHKKLSTPVANCHKQPEQWFEKRLFSVAEITQQYQVLIESLKKFNPELKIIFTVSPVKHLKDGIIENNLSKSTLLLAVAELCQLNTHCHYFPAYELVNDDLRDYRFYKVDMAHPNEQAIEYVWEKFGDCYFNEHTKKINHELAKLNAFMQHRSLHANAQNESESAQFIKRQKEIIQALYPQIQF